MEYLPGEPLDYRSDLLLAASTFADIHGLPCEPTETQFLVREPGPFTGIYNEASRLLEHYFKNPDADKEVRGLLEKVLGVAEDKRKEEVYLLQEPWLAVINTEVNSHNFIVNREANTCHLIDWEKPIYGEPAQDLSMFLIATSTLWKQNYRLSQEEEQGFLRAYLQRLPHCSYRDTLFDRVEMFKFFNYLRAISWCAMAWTEYRKPGRPIVNQDTFHKIEAYLQPNFIEASFQ
jgi:thiamine kinase-like enzyme